MRTLALLCLFLFVLAQSNAPAHGRESSGEAPSGQSYWPGPGISGSWYNPQRSGEGFVLEYLSNGTVLVISHDRYFLARLSNRVLELTPEGLHQYGGGYTEYVARTGHEAPGLHPRQ